ncbi:Ger(x)C family spore germination protein [Bacillus sp. EAC]|uniref:Ger(x)C family spore germination protein n=1 Tax=Bacillus sp. EAC TaxID=1978338 RepID=UPI000B44AF44|nr:Ger(x)C family spore germination protein [Bacillus sp. EAC]
MKKALILLLLLPLLTGCWDRLQLRKLNLVDIAAFDLNEENGEVELHYIVTKLKSSGQGSGDATSQVTKLKGPSLVETIGQGQYTDQAPFLGITTGTYMLSESFASHDPVSSLDFLLKTPYSSINIPVVVFEGNLTKFLETVPKENSEFTENLYDFNKALEKNNIIPNISMMNFILSREEPLEDTALPVMKQSDLGVELSGALLFRQGLNTGTKLNKEKVQMMMLMKGKGAGRQRYTGNLSDNSKKQPFSDKTDQINYAYSVKSEDTKITFTSRPNKLPKAKLNVKLEINSYDLGIASHKYKPDYVNHMEKELSKHLEDLAVATIETMQKANCDILGIGKELKAHHPDIWKSLNWRKDYPSMKIEPRFKVQIINSDTE